MIQSQEASTVSGESEGKHPLTTTLLFLIRGALMANGTRGPECDVAGLSIVINWGKTVRACIISVLLYVIRGMFVIIYERDHIKEMPHEYL